MLTYEISPFFGLELLGKVVKEFCKDSTAGVRHALYSIKMHMLLEHIRKSCSPIDFLFPVVHTSTQNAVYDIVFVLAPCPCVFVDCLPHPMQNP